MSLSFKFSERTNWPQEQNELSTLLKELRDEGHDILDLTESNPTRCNFNYPKKEILDALQSEENLSYTPHPQGIQKAREAVAEYYKSKGIDVNPERIFLTANTSEAYSYVFRLLTNPGDHVLFPTPSYPLFQFLVDINDVHLDFYRLTYNNTWGIDFDSFNANSAKAMVVVNPNNPTGSFIKKKELQRINEFCKSNNLAIVSDEVFCDFDISYESDAVSLVNNQDNLTFVFGGLSKALGLPQMKLSWIVLSGPDELVAESIKRLEIIADTYLSVNTPIQNALGDWFALAPKIQEDINKRIHANWNFLVEQQENLKVCEVLRTEGGWYAIVRISKVRSEEEWVLRFLRKYHVFVHPGFFFDFEDEGYIVVSLIVPCEVFQEGMGRVLSRVEQEEG